MTRCKCFVSDCKTGLDSHRKKYKKEGKKYPSLFSMPSDPALFKLWEIAICRADKKLTKDAKVCELHFQEGEIEKFYITKLPDGTIDKMEKGRYTLKSGAIPSLFLNGFHVIKNSLDECMPEETDSPSVSTETAASVENNVSTGLNHSSRLENLKITEKESANVSLVRKVDSKNIINITYVKNVPVIENSFSCQHLSRAEPVINDCFTYEKLCENLTMIKKPNDWWCISPTAKYVVCARWNDYHVVERKIVIDYGLAVKVYLRDREIVIPSQVEVSSVDDISALLKKVERYGICAGVDKWKNCLVCLFDLYGVPGRTKKWCEQCKISAKREYKISRGPVKNALNAEIKAAVKHRKLCQEIKYERRKKVRLINKVERLRRRLKLYEKLCPSIKSEVFRLSSLPSIQDSVQPFSDVSE